MLVATFVILFAVGIYASTAIKNGIFQERLNQVLEEAATQARTAQNRFDQAPASTVEQVQSLAQDVVTSISTLTSGSSAPAVLILRNPSETSSFVINEIATQNMREVITSQLREAVQQKTGQHWQSIEITDAQGKRHPGIAVGTAVSLPLAGAHELYLVYSLADEQAAINLVMGVLGGGGLAVLVLVCLLYTSPSPRD